MDTVIPAGTCRAKDKRSVTVIVDGEEFVLAKPFLSIHSPAWAGRFAEDPELVRVELQGNAQEFRIFFEFLTGIEGQNNEITVNNVLPLLRWGARFDVDYILSMCESFLLTKMPPEFDPIELLEIAAEHKMSLLYSRLMEILAQGMNWVDVPDGTDSSPIPAAFNVRSIREDIVGKHIQMGLLRNDGEMQCRYRFADHTTLDDHKQRARLLWKTQRRFIPPAPEPAEHDWKSLQTVWPHHSLRSDDWCVVPCETQPTMPLRSRERRALSRGLR
jgi:hypothetical protein